MAARRSVDLSKCSQVRGSPTIVLCPDFYYCAAPIWSCLGQRTVVVDDKPGAGNIAKAELWSRTTTKVSASPQFVCVRPVHAADEFSILFGRTISTVPSSATNSQCSPSRSATQVLTCSVWLLYCGMSGSATPCLTCCWLMRCSSWPRHVRKSSPIAVVLPFASICHASPVTG